MGFFHKSASSTKQPCKADGDADFPVKAANQKARKKSQKNQRKRSRLDDEDERRTFSKDVWPADREFSDAIYHLQFGWKHPEFGGTGTRYERKCWDNLIKVAGQLPLRGD